MALNFPYIDPVAFTFGPVSIKWYAFAYLVGILYSYFFISKKLKLDQKQCDILLLCGVTGVILGGRLGYVLFYNIEYYFYYPAEIIKIWHGGMSFHGGLIGVIISLFYFAKKYDLKLLQLFDIAACTTGLGIFLGRIANFINGELYGKKTEVIWGVVFKSAGAEIRHPSQIYEAILEGVLPFIILNFLFFFTKAKNYNGLLSGLGFCLYGAARIFAEFFREPDVQIGYLFNIVTIGQVLSMPFFILGIILIVRSGSVKA